MAYTQPGVTVTQLQKTQSFPLPNPSLKSCVVGPGYYYQDPSNDASVYDYKYDGSEIVVSGEEVSDYTDYIDGTLTVELIRSSGPSGTIGEVEILTKDTDFTVSNSEITINADLSGYTASEDKADIRLSFLAKRPSIVNTFEQINSEQDIRDLIGEPISLNPLAFGAELALANGGVSTSVVGVTPAAGAESFGDAIEELELHEVYAIAPMTNVASEAEKFDAHVTAMSEPEAKKERIAFTARRYGNYPVSDPATKSEKATSAQEIQNYSSAINNKRYFSIHPEGGWILERRHLNSLSASYLQSVYGGTFDLLPKFSTTVEVGGAVYRPGDTITQTALDAMKATKDSKYSFMTVLAPIPGYFFAAALAGQVAGKAPQAPLTNSGISGFQRLYRSNDYFTQEHLNTIAEGGTWILVEKGPGAIVNRHQLSTNATTIETRELSITNQLDNASKFLRDLAEPLIGKFTISDQFLINFEATLNGGAERLVEKGEIRNLEVLKVYQDEVEPDTVKADVVATVLYPVNKIKYTITF